MKVKEWIAERKLKFIGIVLAGLVVLAVVPPISTTFTVPIFTKSTVVATVTDKDRECSIEGSKKECVYKIYTDKGVFVNHDTLVYFKFKSANLQGKLIRGEKYKLNYYGYRVGFFSWFPNVTSAEKVTEEKAQ